MSTETQRAWMEQGALQERFRIIALLDTDEAFAGVYFSEGDSQEALDALVRLIKGEETA